MSVYCHFVQLLPLITKNYTISGTCPFPIPPILILVVNCCLKCLLFLAVYIPSAASASADHTRTVLEAPVVSLSYRERQMCTSIKLFCCYHIHMLVHVLKRNTLLVNTVVN